MKVSSLRTITDKCTRGQTFHRLSPHSSKRTSPDSTEVHPSPKQQEDGRGITTAAQMDEDTINQTIIDTPARGGGCKTKSSLCSEAAVAQSQFGYPGQASGVDTSLATTSETETTTDAVSTIAPASNPTYALLANGGNLNNRRHHSKIELTSAFIFDPSSPMTGSVRTFTIKPTTGRLKDANGEAYVCVYYEGSRGMSPPPVFGYCNPNNSAPNKGSEYLKCKVESGALSSSVPGTTCEGRFALPP
ncbi:hypothetical protein FPCIR_82 [Fusarium pseudocircinatum]|uniref:Uncharacterized protein n=1 Tax=Fusarium pseudocircinatum TaxID=56676 RepID=A0A8H5PZM9_9HYPO|nr:hypothetical protein FPCIR_82 [Fusarium pseudocircinatum]